MQRNNYIQSKAVGPAVGKVLDVALLVRGCLTLTPKKQALLRGHAFFALGQIEFRILRSR